MVKRRRSKNKLIITFLILILLILGFVFLYKSISEKITGKAVDGTTNNLGNINGKCGSANGKTYSTLDESSTELCSQGNSALFSTTGWSWFCFGSNGGNTVACSANKFDGVLLDPNKNWISCNNDIENGRLMALYQIKIGPIKIPFPSNFANECIDNKLREYSCVNKNPGYKDTECAEECEENKCINPQDKLDDNKNMVNCVSECNLDYCNQINDKDKKDVAMEQYSINCNNDLCKEENCAKKIAINLMSMTGSGTKDDPYQIENCLQLESINDLSANYILVKDIDCIDTINWDNGQGFQPIGYWVSERVMDGCFKGSFDGNGYVIGNLFIGRPINSMPTGVFSCIYKASINNLVLINSNINGGSNTGGLIGKNWQGNVDDSVFNGKVTGLNFVGGLVGSNNGKIYDSYSSGNIANEKNFYSTGGLVGTNNNGEIYNSYSTSTINGQTEAGGLAGMNSGKIVNSFFDGYIYGNSISNIGLITGVNTNLGSIEKSYYFDNTNSNIKCVGKTGGGSENCFIAENSDYFKGSVRDKEPFNQWDFVNKWREIDGSYPQLILKRNSYYNREI